MATVSITTRISKVVHSDWAYTVVSPPPCIHPGQTRPWLCPCVSTCWLLLEEDQDQTIREALALCSPFSNVSYLLKGVSQHLSWSSDFSILFVGPGKRLVSTQASENHHSFLPEAPELLFRCHSPGTPRQYAGLGGVGLWKAQRWTWRVTRKEKRCKWTAKKEKKGTTT